ncbi:MAG: hypothetical protein CR997_00300 [Acidobacteria bacterium]|nr:MAG: hypothetical protein CR997_00300 [Acidobacteriota bacterium]
MAFIVQGLFSYRRNTKTGGVMMKTFISLLFCCLSVLFIYSAEQDSPTSTRQAGLLWQGADFDQWDPNQSYSFSKAKVDFGDYPNFFNAPLLPFNTYLAQMPDKGTVMRVLYREGLYSDTGSGAIWRSEFSSSHSELVLEFDAYFEPGFQFVRGGKFHGLCSRNCYSNADPVPGDGMSVRFMWRQADDQNRARIVLYVYHTDMPGVYGQDLPLLQGGPRARIQADSSIYFPDIDETFTLGYEDRDYVGPWPVIRFEDDRWYRLKLRVKLNDPGLRNGAIQTWIDDELVLNMTGFEFAIAGANPDDYLLKYFLFQTFHGGGDDSWAPSEDVYAYYDSFKVESMDCDSLLASQIEDWNAKGSTWNILNMIKSYLPLSWSCE